MKNKVILSICLLSYLFLANNAFSFSFFSNDDDEVKEQQVEDISNQDVEEINNGLVIDEIDQNNFTNIAILQGLNKVTAKTSEIRALINQPIKFGRIIVEVKNCWKSPPDQKPENKMLLKIYEFDEQQEQKIIFSGWMFSSTPSISSLEHPIYDITAIECKNE